MLLSAIDLNPILNLWPYAAVVAGVPAIFYARNIFGFVKSKMGGAPAPSGGSTPVPVGTLAENLKAIRLHCEKLKDEKAQDACDVIAPVIFHEKETKQEQTA